MSAGAMLDFITPEEQAAQLVELKDFFRRLTREQEGETIVRSAAPFNTDGSGNTASLPRGGSSVYRVPIGFDAYLSRLTVDYEGSSAASPQSCDVRIVADQDTPAALRAINNTVPTVYEASKSHAPLFRGGQEVVVALIAGPVSTAIYVTVQVILTPRKHLSADILE